MCKQCGMQYFKYFNYFILKFTEICNQKSLQFEPGSNFLKSPEPRTELMVQFSKNAKSQTELWFDSLKFGFELWF